MRPGTVIGDRYEIVQLAGVGGTAEVYRGRDKRTSQRVAIKILSSVLAGDPESGAYRQSSDGEQAGMGFDGVAGAPSQRASQTKRLLSLTFSETADRV